MGCGKAGGSSMGSGRGGLNGGGGASCVVLGLYVGPGIGVSGLVHARATH